MLKTRRCLYQCNQNSLIMIINRAVNTISKTNHVNVFVDFFCQIRWAGNWKLTTSWWCNVARPRTHTDEARSVPGFFWDPLHKHGSTLIPAWVSNYFHHKCKIKCLIHSQTSTAGREVREWISDFIPHINGHMVLVHAGIKAGPWAPGDKKQQGIYMRIEHKRQHSR